MMMMMMPLTLVAAAAGSLGCAVTPYVDRHLVRNAMDASLTPSLGWTISPDCGPGQQLGYTVHLDGAGTALRQQSNLSDGVPFDRWAGGLGLKALKPGTS